MGNVSHMCDQANVARDSIGNEGPQDHLYEACNFNHEMKANILRSLAGSTGIEKLEKAETWMKHKDKEEYYLGEWKDRARKGEGIEVVPNKYIYQGSFDHDKHGKGKLIYTQNKITYEGEMVKGRISGEGKVYHHNGEFEFEGKTFLGKPTNGKLTVYNPETKDRKFTATIQEYPEKKAFIDYSDGRHYEGKINIHTFLPEGLGTMSYPNNTSYFGNWLKGMFHGEGNFKWPDGSEYNGHYDKGQKSGRGRLTYSSKKIYIGNWLNGKQDGEGSLVDPDGKELQKGKWKEGKYVAQGVKA